MHLPLRLVSSWSRRRLPGLSFDRSFHRRPHKRPSHTIVDTLTDVVVPKTCAFGGADTYADVCPFASICDTDPASAQAVTVPLGTTHDRNSCLCKHICMRVLVSVRLLTRAIALDGATLERDR
jgi:hypothetical protein